MATERRSVRTDGVRRVLLLGGRPSFARSAMRIDMRRGRSREGPRSGASVSAGRQLGRPFAFQMSVSPGVAALRDRIARRRRGVTDSRRVNGVEAGRTYVVRRRT